MSKARMISRSVLAQLGTWSPDVILPIADEVEARGGDINEDPEITAQAAADVRWLSKNAQKQRVLPLPSRNI